MSTDTNKHNEKELINEVATFNQQVRSKLRIITFVTVTVSKGEVINLFQFSVLLQQDRSLKNKLDTTCTKLKVHLCGLDLHVHKFHFCYSVRLVWSAGKKLALMHWHVNN